MTFRGSRWKALLQVSFLSMLLVGGMLMLIELFKDRSGATALFAVAFALVLFALALTPPWIVAAIIPMRLELDEAGFTFKRPLFRTKRYEWRHIAMIAASRFGRTTTVVWLSDSPSAYHRASRAIFGYDGGLPTGWTVGADELAHTMMRFKLQAERDRQAF